MKRIIKDLKALEGKKIDPNTIRKIISSYNLKTLRYKEFLKGADMKGYVRIPILEEPVQAFIMIRPPQHHLPIHHHNNFWGFIIPLSGIVAETMYNYENTTRKVYIHPTKSYSKGDYIFEPFNLLHKLQNISPIDPAITFHIRYPSTYNYSGTMIIDAKNRRRAILNEKAERVGWDLPDDNYQIIEENAYDLEKLW